MALYRIELDVLAKIHVTRLRHGYQPDPIKGVYGLREGLVLEPWHKPGVTPPRPLDTWFDGSESSSLCFTQNSVLVGLVREFKRRYEHAERVARRERRKDLNRAMQHALTNILGIVKAHT